MTPYLVNSESHYQTLVSKQLFFETKGCSLSGLINTDIISNKTLLVFTERIGCYLPFRYLPATLTPNDDNMMNTFTNSSLNINESSLSLPDARMFIIPSIPKVTDA